MSPIDLAPCAPEMDVARKRHCGCATTNGGPLCGFGDHCSYSNTSACRRRAGSCYVIASKLFMKTERMARDVLSILINQYFARPSVIVAIVAIKES